METFDDFYDEMVMPTTWYIIAIVKGFAVLLMSLIAIVFVSIVPLPVIDLVLSAGRRTRALLITCILGLAIGSLFGSIAFRLLTIANSEFSNEKFDLKYACYIVTTIWIIIGFECLWKIASNYVLRSNDWMMNPILLPRETFDIPYGLIHMPPPEDYGDHSDTDVDYEDYYYDDDDNDDDDDDDNIDRLVGDAHKESMVVDNLDNRFEYPPNEDPVEHDLPLTCEESLNRKWKIAKDMVFSGGIKPSAWIIIVTCILHNFLDGVSIGASFGEDYFPMSLKLTAQIAMEELGHEIGSFVLLLAAGMNYRDAYTSKIAGDTFSFFGMSLGFIFGNSWTHILIAVMIGLFFYVAVAYMTNETIALVDRVSLKSSTSAILMLVTSIGSIFLHFVAVYIFCQ